MQKILCATDETKVSRKAVIFAADLVIAVNAELCYVHGGPPKSGNSGDETKKTTHPQNIAQLLL